MEKEKLEDVSKNAWKTMPDNVFIGKLILIRISVC